MERNVLHREDSQCLWWSLVIQSQVNTLYLFVQPPLSHSPTLPLSQYYRCLVNVPREVCWWQRGSAHAGQAQLILNTQSPLRASFQGGAMFGKHHDQKITEGRVGGEHGSLLTDLTPEPSRGGLRDVCQQNVVLSTALGLSYHSQSVSQSVSHNNLHQH